VRVDMLPPGVELAALRRRAAAASINVLVGIAALITAGLGVFAAFKLRRLWRPLMRRLMRERVSRKLRIEPQFTQWSPQARMMIAVPANAMQLDGRNRRSIGARVMGIRRVDVRTGGSIGLRSALIRLAVSNAHTSVGSRITRVFTRRWTKEAEALQSELRELQRQHAGDAEALNQATMEFHRERGVNPFRSCFVPILLGWAINIVPVLLSPLRQTLPDRAAGIVVVVDQPSPA
jgi:hypothetical protein